MEWGSVPMLGDVWLVVDDNEIVKGAVAGSRVTQDSSVDICPISDCIKSIASSVGDFHSGTVVLVCLCNILCCFSSHHQKSANPICPDNPEENLRK
jgi:hypothetical protein